MKRLGWGTGSGGASFRLTGAAGAALLVVACGTTPDTETTLCNEFRVGADFSQTDFGVSSDVKPSYVALAQATGDISLVAAQMLAEIDASCSELAAELGADMTDKRLEGKLDAERTKVVCQLAADRIRTLKPTFKAAKVRLRLVETKCSVDPRFQSECEATCKADAACTEASAHDRCATSDREGLCSGSCTGACLGTEDAPVDCSGKCEGACFGSCDGADASGKVCSGACSGSCGGTCTASTGACVGRCRGGCDVALTDESCAGPLAPPTCKGDVDCQNACSASAAARADCRDGALSLDVKDRSKSTPAVDRAVHALERNLPIVFLAARGRAKLLSERATTLTDAAGHLLTKGQALGAKGAACGLVIGKTGQEASTNLGAVRDSAKKIADAVDATFGS